MVSPKINDDGSISNKAFASFRESIENRIHTNDYFSPKRNAAPKINPMSRSHTNVPYKLYRKKELRRKRQILEDMQVKDQKINEKMQTNLIE